MTGRLTAHVETRFIFSGWSRFRGRLSGGRSVVLTRPLALVGFDRSWAPSGVVELWRSPFGVLVMSLRCQGFPVSFPPRLDVGASARSASSHERSKNRVCSISSAAWR